MAAAAILNLFLVVTVLLTYFQLYIVALNHLQNFVQISQSTTELLHHHIKPPTKSLPSATLACQILC